MRGNEKGCCRHRASNNLSKENLNTRSSYIQIAETLENITMLQ
jgi:hypothetical protein